MRGEDHAHRHVLGRVGGLPPRARGRRALPLRGLWRRGTTPACAGKTHLDFMFHILRRDYPRVRGEDPTWPPAPWWTGGLPPRARGRRRAKEDTGSHVRTTPACAGKTAKILPNAFPLRDYPRVRGEDRVTKRLWPNRQGLPPRARGRPRTRRTAREAWGTTPACAGKTPPCRTRKPGRRDYPRVRGEDPEAALEEFVIQGLPPRARGRRCRRCRSCRFSGTTPACAGKTGQAQGAASLAGTTPACAGKTSGYSGRRRTTGDYPRVRGEDGSRQDW